MSDDDIDSEPDIELDLPADELDQRASDHLDGVTGPLTGPKAIDTTVATPGLASRVADFERARSLVADVPEAPADALDGLVRAVLVATSGELTDEGPTPPVTPLAPRRARHARRLAPLGAAALVAALLGVVALASRGDQTEVDVASNAPAADATARAETQAETEAETAEPDTTLAETSAASGGADERSPAPTTTLVLSTASGSSAAEASPSAPELGTYATIEELEESLAGAGAVQGGLAGQTDPASSVEELGPSASPSQPCADAGAVLGTAEIAGRPTVVVRRADGTLAALDPDCGLIAETTPTSSP